MRRPSREEIAIMARYPLSIVLLCARNGNRVAIAEYEKRTGRPVPPPPPPSAFLLARRAERAALAVHMEGTR